MRAYIKNYRQSPRKVRRVVDAIRGKKVAEARTILNFLVKRSTGPIHSLLNSAVANANVSKTDENTLFVKSISVNAGKILYRRRPAAHGAAHPVRKRISRIKIVVGQK